MRLSIFIISTLSLVTVGCATKGVSTADHTNPAAKNIIAEKHFTDDQSQVWDRLVKNMATSFFVINNIDKESRIINLSFSSDRPQDFIDCGKTTRTYFDGKTTATYTYGTVDNIASYKVASPNQPHPVISQHFFIVRTAKLDGRANVYIAPENGGTRVTVNTKSVAHVKLNGDVVNVHAMGHEVARQALPMQSVEFTAITKGPTQNSVANGQNIENIICYSTGALEESILELGN